MAGTSSGGWNSSAAAVLAYDVPHRMPWDWRVSLYTWAKGIAAGAYVVPLPLLVAGLVSRASPLWAWGAPGLGGGFLAITGLLLIADLEHPTRFLKLFLRPQWRSWLTRGAYIITGYGGLLTVWVLFSYLGYVSILRYLEPLLIVLALLTAVYTAFLFAQAKGRDFWQSPMLGLHMIIHSVMAGAAVFLIAGYFQPINAGFSRVSFHLTVAAIAFHLVTVAIEGKFLPYHFSRYYAFGAILAAFGGLAATASFLQQREPGRFRWFVLGVIVPVLLPRLAVAVSTVTVSVPLFEPLAGLTLSQLTASVTLHVTLDVMDNDCAAGLVPPCVAVNDKLDVATVKVDAGSLTVNETGID